MKWITKIIESEPYKITCQWNDVKIRVIDLEELIKRKGAKPGSSYYQLKDKKRFNEVKCDGTTIYWENGIIIKDYDGTEKPGPLDIDPEVLYEISEKKFEKVNS